LTEKEAIQGGGEEGYLDFLEIIKGRRGRSKAFCGRQPNCGSSTWNKVGFWEEVVETESVEIYLNMMGGLEFHINSAP
jgi:hypothetical protein